MSDSDYKSLKRKIFERYLMDVPVVQGIQPVSFLISDMYHFLKSTNPTQDSSKIQTVLKAWVADPNVNTIPQPMLTSFMNATNYFGACNQTWLPITANDFAILPFRNWYDAGVYGEKLIDDNVELLVSNDPFAAKLLEMHKQAAKEVLPIAINPQKFYDSYGNQIQAPIAITLPSIYEPFSDELKKQGALDSSHSAYLAGLSSRCDTINDEERNILESYVKNIMTHTDLLIGGGTHPNFDVAKSAYFDVRHFQKDILSYVYAEKYSSFSDRIENIKMSLGNKIGYITITSAGVKMVDPVFEKNYVYLFHFISYIVNKISDGVNNSLPDKKELLAYKQTLNNFVNDIVDRFKNTIHVYLKAGMELPECKPMFIELLECTSHDYCELFIDVEPSASESFIVKPVPLYTDELLITYKSGKHFATTSKVPDISYSNKTYGLLDKDGNATRSNDKNSMYAKRNEDGYEYRIVTAMSFMQNGYRQYVNQVIGDDEYFKRQLEINKLIDGVGMTFDFIIIKINEVNESSTLYGVRCN
jgi:hypothetical protein